MPNYEILRKLDDWSVLAYYIKFNGKYYIAVTYTISYDILPTYSHQFKIINESSIYLSDENANVINNVPLMEIKNSMSIKSLFETFIKKL